MENKNQLQKRYGLLTAICMVVGIVIGSGVFFKAQDILKYTEGNILLGILAWAIGGFVLVICALNFSTLATRHAKVNGLVDYAEATVGKKFAYMTGWFTSTIYYPAMTSVLAWVSARYTLVLFNPDADITSGLCIALGAFYLCFIYALNVLSPKLAGKFQVSTTVIKLIPLVIMVVVGTIAGLINGNTVDAFVDASKNLTGGSFSGVLAGVAAAAFAYEGWIIATTVNAELKNAKRNLPIALVVGTLIIVAVYILYFIGLTGGASVDVLIEKGATTAFTQLFGTIAGTVLNVFVVVSCLGTLNGLMLGSTRAFYSIAARDCGPKPDTFAAVDRKTNMPANASVLALVCCAFWFFYFYAANLTAPIFGLFSFDSSELPIITIYALYIPIFVMFLIKLFKNKEVRGHVVKHLIMPILGILVSIFMVFVAIYAHGIRPYEAAKNATTTVAVDGSDLVFTNNNGLLLGKTYHAIGVMDGADAAGVENILELDNSSAFTPAVLVAKGEDGKLAPVTEIKEGDKYMMVITKDGETFRYLTGELDENGYFVLSDKEDDAVAFTLAAAEGEGCYTLSYDSGYFSFPVAFYLIVFAVVMIVGALLYKKKVAPTEAVEASEEATVAEVAADDATDAE